MKRLSIALAMLATTAASPVAAQPAELTGAELLRVCADYGKPQAPNGLICMGLTYGIWQSRALVRNYLREAPSSWLNGGCAPKDVTIEQLVRVATAYLEKHPEAHHLPAASPVWLAYIEAFWPLCDHYPLKR